LRNTGHKASRDLRDCGNILRRLRTEYVADDGNVDYILRKAATACEHCRRKKISPRIFKAVDDIVRSFTETAGIPPEEELTPDYIAAQLDKQKPGGEDDGFTLDELCFVPDCIALSLLFTLDEYSRAQRDTKHADDLGMAGSGKSVSELAADAASTGAELLRSFEETSFERFLEKASVIERTLLADKRGIYPRCDHETKQLYRQAAAEYAKKHKVSQRHAAEIVLAMRSPVKEHPILRRAYFPIMYLAAFILAILAAVLTRGDLFMALLLFFPLTEFTRQCLDFVLSKFVPPGAVPRYKIERIDDMPETLVVITTLLFGGKSDDSLFESLERCYHANRDRGGKIAFGILGDLPDAASPEAPGDAATLKNAKNRIKALNKKYGGGFYLFTRSRTYSATEERYMGRERKRGALLELAGFIAAGERGSLTVVGDESFLSRVKYVITLDSDTRLGLGGACDLIGAMLHPANLPVVKNGIVTEGYAIMQPRMETSLEAAGKTPFARLISGCGGSDVYSSAAYETYQTLFGEGNFCGKGIFDVKLYWELLKDAFAPETVLSHDLLEGTRLRCAFLSGVTVVDSCPKTADSYFKRLHRWIRGDTQAMAYAGSTILTGNAAKMPSPSAVGITGSAGISEYRRRARVKNPISVLSRYKLFDNIRRASLPICAIFAMAYGLFMGSAAALTAIIFSTLYIVLPVVTASVTATRSLPRRFYSSVTGSVWQALGLTLWNLGTLLHNAICAADAMLRALWRMTISKQRLLEWVTAAEADRNRRDTFGYNLLLTLPTFISGAVLVIFAPYALYKLLGLLWLGLPLLFTLSGRETVTEAELAITPARRATVMKYVFDMWKFFSDTVTASEHWLPPDNIQLAPSEILARRTSPTNIGLYMLSCLAAYKLGNIKSAEFSKRIENAVTSIEMMPKWRGHLYNWYDTATLSVLGTPYVSTVDSGNFVASLLTLSQGIATEKSLKGDRADKLRERISAIIDATDFSALYNPDRDLFYLGYDTAAEKPGGGYDLLMSESRITSYYAVAAGIVPRRHWQRLGRPVISADGHIGLLSWSGTMFEYFMASLFMPVYKGSLIDEALAFAFTQQKKERERGLWGKSESCYFAFDAAMNYQYSAYGVQKLAMKRGLDTEAVIAPYSSFLTLTYAPIASLRNLERLKKFGLYGRYGFFESVDFTRSRVGRGCAVIRTFMAHHIGMSIIAAANFLLDNIFVKYFMSDPRMGAADSLLCEKIPVDAVIHKTVPYRKEMPTRTHALPTAESFREDNKAVPRTAVVSNGGTRIVATAAGKVCLYNGNSIITTSPFGPNSKNGGLKLFLEVKDKRGSRVINVLDGGFCRSSSSTSVKYINEVSTGGSRAKTIAILTVRGDCTCFVITLAYEGGAAEVCPLMCFVPALKPEKEYGAHPGYHDLSVEAEYCAEENILLYRVLSREGEKERWLAVTLETSSGGVSFTTRREGVLPMLYGDRELGMLTQTPLGNTTGACITPFCAIKKRSETRSGRYACTFLVAPAKSRADAIQTIRYARSTRERNYADSAISSLRRWAQAGMSVLSAPDSMRAAELMLAATFHTLRKDYEADSEAGKLVMPDEPQPKSVLWRNSISGDLPFTVISISTRLAPGDASCHLIAAFISAHRWLRIMGIKTELIICYGEIAAYGEPVRTMLIDLVRAHGDVRMLGAPGGVYFLRSSPDTALLRMLSRLDIVLDGTNTLSNVYLRVMSERPELVFHKRPRIRKVYPQEVENSVETDVRLPVRGGFFGVDNFTVKTREQTLPQSYVYTGSAFGTLVTHNSLGYTWFGNSRERRLTPWNGLAHEGMQGERLILHINGKRWDLAASAHTVTYNRGHALYSGRIESGGISTDYEIAVGVDPLLPVKMIAVTFDGEEATPRTEVRDNVCGAFTPEGAADGHSGVKLVFEWTLCFGSDPCDPDVIVRECSGDTVTYKCMYGEFTHRRIFMTCRPAERGVIYLLGTTGERDDKCGSYIREKYKTLSDVYEGFSLYAARAERVSGGLLLESPSPALDEMFNFYVPYQALATRLLARTGFYQSGGAYGFRDQLQDCLAILYSHPKKVRVHIIRAALHQFAQGDAMHWWHNLPARDTVVTRGVRSLCSDDYIWLPYVTAEYVRRTGDTSILSVKVRYADAPELGPGEYERYSETGKTDFKEDIYTHCARALELALERLSPRGLPYIGSCDWNDGMNRIGIDQKGNQTGGESVWLAQFLAITLNNFSKLSELRGDIDGCEKYRAAAASLLLAVEKHAWATDRYARAFYGDGLVLGAPTTEGGCQIDILPQAFAQLSGMGKDETGSQNRTRTALENMYSTLFDREHRIMKLFAPPFVPGNGRNPGYIQGYVPGVRENGGQYTHAAVWAAIALLDAGMTEQGVELLRAINPAERCTDHELGESYGGEPYALAGDVYSNPDFAGRCGWSMYTGAAAWYYKAVLEYLLGYDEREGGFTITPKLTESFPNFTLQVNRHGTQYTIRAERGSKTEYKLDGKIVNNYFPFDKKRHLLEITVEI
jgi:cyclic beta-1,2-glucan synthetase